MVKEWDGLWMSMAVLMSHQSDDEGKAVGAIIVSTNDEKVLGIGTNKLPVDLPGHEPQVTGHSGYVHAERNAISNCSMFDASPRKLYVTLSPCINCAKLIEESSIEEVIYLTEHSKTEGIEYLREKGIIVRQ